MKGLLILAVVLVSSFGVPVSATNYHEEAEFQRSMARYRQFFEQEDTAAIMRTLLQVHIVRLTYLDRIMGVLTVWSSETPISEPFSPNRSLHMI